VRRVQVVRATNAKGGMRVTTQLEDADPELLKILAALGVET
jgi:hypothetical protein